MSAPLCPIHGEDCNGGPSGRCTTSYAEPEPDVAAERIEALGTLISDAILHALLADDTAHVSENWCESAVQRVLEALSAAGWVQRAEYEALKIEAAVLRAGLLGVPDTTETP